MVVRWDFVRVGPLVYGQSKDTHDGVHGCKEENHAWGCMSE
jgi:hypothetical protein